MKRLVVASMKQGAGKTTIITGIARNISAKCIYLKPFGDRMVYLKKRLWDHDAALMTGLLDLRHPPEVLSIGFDHSKLRYMHDEDGIRNRLGEMIRSVSGEEGFDTAGSTEPTREPPQRLSPGVLFVEGGKDLQYGSFVHLDPLSICRFLDAELLLILHGDDNSIMDQVTHFGKWIHRSGIRTRGVILNRIHDPEDFRDTYLPDLEMTGPEVVGIIPHHPELERLTIRGIADSILAKVIAGETRLDRPVNHVFVGAMSVDAARRNPLFQREGKLIITGGDRSDMILAALETDSAGIILTNNIIPPPSIISRAAEREIPLMVVPHDTYTITMQINRLEPLLTDRDEEKIRIIEKLVADNVDIPRILE